MRQWDESKCKRDEDGKFACKDNETPKMRKGGLLDGAGSESEEKKPFININLFSPVNYTGYTRKGLRSAHKSHNLHIAKHVNYINNPHIKYPNWDNMTEREKRGAILFWEKEIKNSNNQIRNIEEEINRRCKHEST